MTSLPRKIPHKQQTLCSASSLRLIPRPELGKRQPGKPSALCRRRAATPPRSAPRAAPGARRAAPCPALPRRCPARSRCLSRCRSRCRGPGLGSAGAAVPPRPVPSHPVPRSLPASLRAPRAAGRGSRTQLQQAKQKQKQNFSGPQPPYRQPAAASSPPPPPGCGRDPAPPLPGAARPPLTSGRNAAQRGCRGENPAVAARHTARRRRRRRRRAPCDRRLKAAQPAVSGLGEAAPQGGRRDEHAAGCRQGSDGHCPAQPGEFGLRNVSLKGFVLLMASMGEPHIL